MKICVLDVHRHCGVWVKVVQTVMYHIIIVMNAEKKQSIFMNVMGKNYVTFAMEREEKNMKLIDKTRLVRLFDEILSESHAHEDGTFPVDFRLVNKLIKAQPSFDLTLCKDCEYCGKPGEDYYGDTYEYWFCKHEPWDDSEGWARGIKPDDFCSYGVSKEV